jgi:hypothetical protein
VSWEQLREDSALSSRCFDSTTAGVCGTVRPRTGARGATSLHPTRMLMILTKTDGSSPPPALGPFLQARAIGRKIRNEGLPRLDSEARGIFQKSMPSGSTRGIVRNTGCLFTVPPRARERAGSAAPRAASARAGAAAHRESPGPRWPARSRAHSRDCCRSGRVPAARCEAAL